MQTELGSQARLTLSEFSPPYTHLSTELQEEAVEKRSGCDTYIQGYLYKEPLPPTLLAEISDT